MSDSLLRKDEEIADIYNQYVNMVYRIAFMILKNIPESEDATQTVFIKFMVSNQKFESVEHIKAWLIVTVKNECRDILRSTWRLKWSDSKSVESQTYNEEIQKHGVFDKIIALDHKYKIPIYLYYYEGYKTFEIAKMLRVNHATIRTRLKTAKKKLKLMIEEDEDFE